MTTTSTNPDVVDILTEDHHAVLDLVESIPEADPETRRDLADTVIAELVRHSVAEEMYVYPVVAETLPDGEATVEQDKREHQQLEEAMKKLESVDADDAQFLEVLGELEAVLRDHVADEENDQFPELRKHVPADRLVEMGRQVETAKQVAPTRPHPGSPHSALFHKLAGPGVGMVDRLRDHITGRASNT